MLAMDKQGVNPPKNEGARILVIPVDENTLAEAFRISTMLRREGIAAEIEVMRRSLSRSLSDASRRGITHAVIVGPREISEGKVVLRNMEGKTQEEVKIKDLPGEIKA